MIRSRIIKNLSCFSFRGQKSQFVLEYTKFLSYRTKFVLIIKEKEKFCFLSNNRINPFTISTFIFTDILSLMLLPYWLGKVTRKCFTNREKFFYFLVQFQVSQTLPTTCYSQLFTQAMSHHFTKRNAFPSRNA